MFSLRKFIHFTFTINSMRYLALSLAQEPHFTCWLILSETSSNWNALILSMYLLIYLSLNLKGLYRIYFATLFSLEPNKIGHPRQETTSNVTGKECLRKCADVSEVRTVAAENYKMPFWGAMKSRGGMVKFVIFFILCDNPNEYTVIVIWGD